MPNFGVSFTDDARVIIYNCNVFIILNDRELITTVKSFRVQAAGHLKTHLSYGLLSFKDIHISILQPIL
jgi:hypothetical protein